MDDLPVDVPEVLLFAVLLEPVCVRDARFDVDEENHGEGVSDELDLVEPEKVSGRVFAALRGLLRKKSNPNCVPGCGRLCANPIDPVQNAQNSS